MLNARCRDGRATGGQGAGRGARPAVDTHVYYTRVSRPRQERESFRNLKILRESSLHFGHEIGKTAKNTGKSLEIRSKSRAQQNGTEIAIGVRSRGARRVVHWDRWLKPNSEKAGEPASCSRPVP